MKEKLVREVIRKYMKKNGYDSIKSVPSSEYKPECECTYPDDIAPCMCNCSFVKTKKTNKKKETKRNEDIASK